MTSRAEGRTDRSSSSATACGKSASAASPEHDRRQPDARRCPFTIVGVRRQSFWASKSARRSMLPCHSRSEPLILGPRSSIGEPRSFTFVLLVEAEARPIARRRHSRASIDPARCARRHTGSNGRCRCRRFCREPFVAVPAPTGTSDFSRLRVQYQRPILTLLVLVGSCCSSPASTSPACCSPVRPRGGTRSPSGSLSGDEAPTDSAAHARERRCWHGGSHSRAPVGGSGEAAARRAVVETRH